MKFCESSVKPVKCHFYSSTFLGWFPFANQYLRSSRIHLQGFYRRSACRRQAQNSRTIIAPGKMFRPMITGGVKEWRFSASGWINRLRSCGLVSIWNSR
jgi:hypothetical protein